MAKPDLEDGWFQLAYGMMPALLCARFRVEAAVVLCEILAQVYGKAKRPHATLDVPEIAKRWGFQRPNAWRGLAELKAAGVAVEVDGYRNRVRFDKAALVAMLPPNIAAAVAGFAEHTKAFEPEPGPKGAVSTVDTASKGRNGSTVSKADTPTVSTSDTAPVSTVDTLSGSPLEPPYKGGEAEKGEKGGRASSLIPSRPKEFDDLCREADSDPALRSGAFGPKLRGAWGQDGELRRLWPDIPLATWRAALATLAGKPADKMQPRFYLGIVKKMPAPPPAGMRPSQAPPPSRSAVYDVYEAPRRPSNGRK